METGKKIRQITIQAACIALVFIGTMVLQVRLPILAQGGLIHLGNVPLFFCAVLFGKRTGALAGGVGMALFDLLSGWSAWAPFTFLIVGVMGFLVGAITEKNSDFIHLFLAFLIAGIVKVTGYYIAEGILYGNWISPITSIPGNIAQIVVAACVVLPFANRMKQFMKKVGYEI